MDYNRKKEEQRGKRKRKLTAAELDALMSSPTTRERAKRAGGDLGNTGTNVSYEGPTSTSPAGTGYNSGQSGTGAAASSNSEEDARTLASNAREKDADNKDEGRKKEDRKTDAPRNP